MRYFLDTNIIIYAMKDTYPALKARFMGIPAPSIAIPSVVLAEIEYGARKSRDYEETIRRYRAFTDVFDHADVTPQTALCYGEIRAALEKTGMPIGANDLLIAATVLSEGGILVTHNTREFERVAGLRIEDWTL